ncbi:MAG: hypothetical protein ACRCYU_21235 [Nocardioides sp.]
MKEERERQLSVRMIAANVLPAYIGPAAIVSVNARMIDNQQASDALARAALTTISIPSALAALVVVAVLARPGSRNRSPKLARSIGRAALGCGALAAAVSAFLVGNGLVADRLFFDAVPSAALGGAITAAQMIRARRRTTLVTPDLGAEGPAVVSRPETTRIGAPS